MTISTTIHAALTAALTTRGQSAYGVIAEFRPTATGTQLTGIYNLRDVSLDISSALKATLQMATNTLHDTVHSALVDSLAKRGQSAFGIFADSTKVTGFYDLRAVTADISAAVEAKLGADAAASSIVSKAKEAAAAAESLAYNAEEHPVNPGAAAIAAYEASGLYPLFTEKM